METNPAEDTADSHISATIDSLRPRSTVTPTGASSPLTSEQAIDKETASISESRQAAGLVDIATNQLTGLALSGGGIRSATFCLGVLQALAKRDKLKRLDYLSTVSGGGYIGSWLSAWIRRTNLDEVCKGLNPETVRADGSSEAPEVTWLRRYSNYLTPRLGMLSADSMTLVATWCRNVLLNLLIFVSFFALWFLLPRLLLEPTMFAIAKLRKECGYAALWLGFFLFPLSIKFHLSKTKHEDSKGKIILLNSTWGVLLIVVIPGLLTALLGSIALLSKYPTFSALIKLGLAAIALMVCSGFFWVGIRLADKHRRAVLKEAGVYFLAYVGAIVVGVILLGIFTQLVRPIGDSPVEKAANLLTFGPPAMLLTFGAVGSVIVGLVGRTYFESTREWWSRMNAWFIILGLIWLALFALSFYAVPVLQWAHERSNAWVTTIAGTSWIGSLLATLLSRTSSTPEKDIGGKLIGAALDIALLVVVVGLLFGVAAGVGIAVEKAGARVSGHHAAEYSSPAKKNDKIASDKSFPVELRVNAAQNTPTLVTLRPIQTEPNSLYDYYIKESFNRQNQAVNTCIQFQLSNFEIKFKTELLECPSPPCFSVTALIAFGFLAVFLLFGYRVDVNKFSLHNLYKNRLIRCYLGASHKERKPNPFTGFDEEDDISLHESPTRPLHILNAAVNITQGSNLAWQERKAAAFTFSRLHCGFALGPSTGDTAKGDAANEDAAKGQRGGYRASSEWASSGEERKAFSLGMAMATSGAAVSPNQGKSSKPALAFITTLFNVRLGRWSPNPKSTIGWQRSSPRYGLIQLLQELFGYSSEVSNFLYLSDGGHFDNTGVYELVRRKCTTIIAVDATADGNRAMGDLADMVRKCRIDFGVRINLNLDVLGTSRPRQSHSRGYVVGTIDYGKGQESGALVIIKPTLINSKELSVDIFGYSRLNANFPHQSTADQFFSESQFESYRELGERIGTTCIDDRAVSSRL